MKRSKKIFVTVGVLFIIGVCLVTYDIFTRTSPPGSKKYLKESILPSEDKTGTESPSDSTVVTDPENR